MDADALRDWLATSGDPAGSAWELVLERKPSLAAAYVGFARLGRENPALDARTRDCIVLRVIEGLSYQEIGRRCGQSEAAVKMRVLRGLRALRAQNPRLAESPRAALLA